MFRISVILSCVVLAWPQSVEAGGCRTCYKAPYVKQVRVVEQVAYPQVTNYNFYQVGAQVREYAIAPKAIVQAEAGQIQREMQRLQDKLTEWNERQQMYAQPQTQCQTCQGQQPAEAAPQDERPTFSMENRPITQAHCAKCHTGDRAKGKLRFDQPLNFDQKMNMLEQAESGEMPKNGQRLTDEEVNQLGRENFSEDEWNMLKRMFSRPQTQEELPPPGQTPPQDHGEAEQG